MTAASQRSRHLSSGGPSERFADVRPAATMVLVAGLIDPAMLVEIELEACVG